MSKPSIKFIENNVNAPQGFSSSGIAAGIKGLHALDLGLIFSKVPAVAAGVFTQNKINAAPLTTTSITLLAPSPSSTIFLAKIIATCSNPA